MIIIRKNQLIYNYISYKCSIGKNGLSQNKTEGDGCTPVGIFNIKRVFYRKDRINLPNISIPKKIILDNSGWCDDSKSNQYNKLINFPFCYSAEKLYMSDNLYDIVCEINYNQNPTIKNKGSAIFMHLANKKFQPTEGCIALNKANLIKLLTQINVGTSIFIRY